MQVKGTGSGFGDPQRQVGARYRPRVRFPVDQHPVGAPSFARSAPSVRHSSSFSALPRSRTPQVKRLGSHFRHQQGLFSLLVVLVFLTFNNAELLVLRHENSASGGAMAGHSSEHSHVNAGRTAGVLRSMAETSARSRRCLEDSEFVQLQQSVRA